MAFLPCSTLSIPSIWFYNRSRFHSITTLRRPRVFRSTSYQYIQPSATSTSSNSTTSDQSSDQSSDPFNTIFSTVQSTINNTFEFFFNPVQASCPVLQRSWTRRSGNYILCPPTSIPPKAVIHFLGGAFFGAAPHISYNTFLRRLSERGYIVVATPYNLSFNYLQVVQSIVSCWESVESDLAAEYGPLPIIGLGHSAGSLFHALASSLFDDITPKAANILISFNNRPASSAIPMYKQLVAPTARAAITLANSVPEATRTKLLKTPEILRKAFEESPLTPKALISEVMPTADEARMVLEQIWPLLREVAGMKEEEEIVDEMDEGLRQEDAPEFYPNPQDVKDSVASLYAVTSTLIVQFENDELDDSEDISTAIRRRGVDGSVDVSMVTLNGSHVTPLAQDPPDLSAAAEAAGIATVPAKAAVSVAQEVVGVLGMKQLIGLEGIIDEWIDTGIENERF